MIVMKISRAKSCTYLYCLLAFCSYLATAAFHSSASSAASSRTFNHNHGSLQSSPRTLIESFHIPMTHARQSHCERKKRIETTLRLSKVCESDDSELFESIAQMPEQDDILQEIAWRSTKVKLEEANTRRFQQTLRSKPWKLPYDDARIWVQKNLGVDTKEEFFDLVANGNLRTPYIPKEPEKYYSDNGTWISWDHFLKG